MKQQLRQQVLERDGYYCQRCLSQKRLDIHHVIPVDEGGTDELSNLKSYCHKCHFIVEYSSVEPAIKGIKVKESTYNDLVSFSSSMTDTFAGVLEKVVEYYKKGHQKK